MESSEFKDVLRERIEGLVKVRLADVEAAITAAQAEVGESLQRLLQSTTSADVNYADDPTLDQLSKEIGAQVGQAAAESSRLSGDLALLRDSVVDIDSQQTQADVLNVLVDRAASFAPRVVLFVLKGKDAIAWAARGFNDEIGDGAVRGLSVSLQSETVLGAVLNGGATFLGVPHDHADNAVLLDRLGTVNPERIAGIPLRVRGKVAAVLYADTYDTSVGSISIEALELLVHSAGIIVELASLRQRMAEVAPISGYTAPSPQATGALSQQQQSTGEYPNPYATTITPRVEAEEVEPEPRAAEAAPAAEPESVPEAPSDAAPASSEAIAGEEPAAADDDAQDYVTRVSAPTPADEEKTDEHAAEATSEYDAGAAVADEANAPASDVDTGYVPGGAGTSTEEPYSPFSYDDAPTVITTPEADEEGAVEPDRAAPSPFSWQTPGAEPAVPEPAAPEPAAPEPAAPEPAAPEPVREIDYSAFSSGGASEVSADTPFSAPSPFSFDASEPASAPEQAAPEQAAPMQAAPMQAAPKPAAPEPAPAELVLPSYESAGFELSTHEEEPAEPSFDLPTSASEPSFDIPAGAPSFGFEEAPVAPLPVVEEPPASKPRPERATAPAPGEVSEEEEKLHNDARRFARLLVSEIKLYNEQRVVEGRANNDLYDRLKEDIDRSRQMYEKRVAPVVAEKFDYFYDELLNTLAQGEGDKLGPECPGPTV